jgi:cytochrome b561
VIRNTTTQWGWPARLLHWLGAAAILVLIGHGWWMTHMTLRPDRLANYTWHGALGYDLMALVLLRMLWRWANPVPALPADTPRWECWAAHAGHFGLYVLMLATSVLGWALAGTFRSPMNLDLFGLPVPQIVGGPDRDLHRLLEDSHKVLAYVLAALVVVHVASSLRHHFVKRNDILRRMLSGAG